MLAKQRPGWLAGFVNVDGNLTEADCSLISAPAATAIDFEQWFEAFSERIYREGLERRVLRRYHAGLLLSHRPTFLTASRSPVQLSQNGPLRQVYSTLSLPRTHFHSTTEFSEASRQFLAEQSLAHVAFEGVGHWIMREAQQDFYQRLGDWLSHLEQERQ